MILTYNVIYEVQAKCTNLCKIVSDTKALFAFTYFVEIECLDLFSDYNFTVRMCFTMYISANIMCYPNSFILSNLCLWIINKNFIANCTSDS
jgi:hypothetical protein